MKLTNSLVAAAILLSTAFGTLAKGKNHIIAFHVDQNDPKIMNMTLNNVQNVRKHYESQGDTVTIELVAYWPGLKMLTADSPIKDRISVMSLESDTIQFSACGNTHRKMNKKAGKDIQLLSEAVMTPSGVVRLVELQESGCAYIRLQNLIPRPRRNSMTCNGVVGKYALVGHTIT